MCRDISFIVNRVHGHVDHQSCNKEEEGKEWVDEKSQSITTVIYPMSTTMGVNKGGCSSIFYHFCLILITIHMVLLLEDLELVLSLLQLLFLQKKLSDTRRGRHQTEKVSPNLPISDKKSSANNSLYYTKFPPRNCAPTLKYCVPHKKQTLNFLNLWG